MAGILIVDDEKDLETLVRLWFSQKIKEDVFHFSFARHGQEALDLLKRHTFFDIIVTDIAMPQLDGLSLLGTLQKCAPTIKTIVISAYDDGHYIESARRQGAFAFMVKPINFNELENLFEKCLDCTPTV